jgi:predicted GIY-YIG superfamily endonuclease
MQDFFVYILECYDGSYYVGHTDNIEKRISDHSIGIASVYTACRLPIKVIFIQPFASRTEAFNAERQIKGWSRKKKEAFIYQNWHALSLLAKKKFNKKSR